MGLLHIPERAAAAEVTLLEFPSPRPFHHRFATGLCEIIELGFGRPLLATDEEHCAIVSLCPFQAYIERQRRCPCQ